ncbi:hypothetical protein OC844_007439 [Tilletia horrida]|nr:hypothetical protein OC844_007439 [Tilletia horrida]
MATASPGTSPATASGDGAGAHTPPTLTHDLVTAALGTQTPTVLGAIAFLKENIQNTFPAKETSQRAKLTYEDARTLLAVSVWLEEHVVSSAHNPAFSTVEHRLDTLTKAVDRTNTEVAKVRATLALRTTVTDEEDDARLVEEALGASPTPSKTGAHLPWSVVARRAKAAAPKAPLEQRMPLTETLLKRSGVEDRPFKALSPADMVSKLRESVKATLPPSGADAAIATADVTKLIRAVRPLPSGDIIICSSTAEYATLLKQHASLWLPKATAAYGVHLPSWSVVVHRVPTTFDPSSPSSVTAFRTENEHLVPTDARISWLTRSSTDGASNAKKHGSVTIQLPTIDQANRLIQEGISYGGRLLRAERAMRSPPQCWRCQRFGHSCSHVQRKCANCSLGHKSTSTQCEERKRAFEAAKVRALRQGDLYLPSQQPST